MRQWWRQPKGHFHVWIKGADELPLARLAHGHGAEALAGQLPKAFFCQHDGDCVASIELVLRVAAARSLHD
jgi:hypothetical protein